MGIRIGTTISSRGLRTVSDNVAQGTEPKHSVPGLRQSTQCWDIGTSISTSRGSSLTINICSNLSSIRIAISIGIHNSLWC